MQSGYIIIVTGSLGSGKSVFSRRLAKILGYQWINIGDLLLQALKEKGIHVPNREKVGWKFLKEMGRSQYFKTIMRAAKPYTILDGILSENAVNQIQSGKRVIHIFRTGIDCNGVNHSSNKQDGFEHDLPQLKASADYEVEWFRTVDEIDQVIQKRFGAIL